MLESIDKWTKVADPDFYSDPANLSWQSPISHYKLYSSLRKPNLPTPDLITHNARWDRYSSLDAMLADQRRWLRFPNNPRPLGPKACLKVNDSERDDSVLRMYFYKCLLQLWLFIRINGWAWSSKVDCFSILCPSFILPLASKSSSTETLSIFVFQSFQER